MKKKILILIAVIAGACLIFGIGEAAGMFPWQYIDEDNVEAFVEDSYRAFTYDLPTAEDKVEWDSILSDDLADRIAAVTYAARNDFALDVQDDAYIISNEELDNETTMLFDISGDQKPADSLLMTAYDDGYLLNLKDVQGSDLTYEITDIFLGLKGSEATRVTVLYTLNGQKCELEYVLAEDKNSPYTFKVVDIEMHE